MLKTFGEFLVNERPAGRLALLVIDEAQNLTLPALEEIRMLSNLETEKSKLLQIILIGQPDLRDKLDRPELEQLRQRITVSYHLEPLDADETSHYINHRLARASIGAPLEFPREVTDRIHARSGGVPRLINVIADATLRVRLRRGAQRDRRGADRRGDRRPRRDRRARSALERRTGTSRSSRPIADGAGARPGAATPRRTPQVARARTAEDDKLARELADRRAGADEARARHGHAASVSSPNSAVSSPISTGC